MLRLGDSFCPKRNQISANRAEPLLAAWTPFQVTAVTESFPLSTTSAGFKNLVVSTPAKIPKLIRFQLPMQFDANRLCEIVHRIEQLPLSFFVGNPVAKPCDDRCPNCRILCHKSSRSCRRGRSQISRHKRSFANLRFFRRFGQRSGRKHCVFFRSKWVLMRKM